MTQQRILIIRLSAIGDIVMSQPLAESLKKYNPNTHITWMSQPENRSLLENNPFIDTIITWDKSHWKTLFKQKRFKQLWQEINTLKKKLQAQQFDLCLDLQGLLKSGIIAYLSGAKKKIGLGSKEGSQLFMDKVISRHLGDQTMISSEYRTLAQYLTHSDYFEFHHFTNSHIQQRVAKLLTSIDISEDKLSYFVICPFTTRPQKHWFDDYWQNLADKIYQHYQQPIVMLGGPADQPASQAIAQSPFITSLVGQTSLPEAAEIIAQAQALIGVDTGLTHMGHAAQVPTLGLFGATKPYLKTPYPQSKILYYPCLCSAGKHDSRPSNDGCMRDLTPQIAFDALTDLLSQSLKINN